MIFDIFSIPFLPWVFRRRLFKVLRKKNEIHCIGVAAFPVKPGWVTVDVSGNAMVSANSSRFEAAN